MSTALDKISTKAKRDPHCRFTSLVHILTVEFLKETWAAMNRSGACGVDGVTILEYEKNLDLNLTRLVERLKANQYRAPYVRRVEIPKGNGKTRPLGIPTVEDRLLQRAVGRILSAIFEQDFLDCSFGFRPEKSPHQAIKQLRNVVIAGKVRRVFETDIKAYPLTVGPRPLGRGI